MRKHLFSWVTLISFLLGLSFGTQAQTVKTSSTRSKVKLNQEKPGVYVSFDRFAKRIPVRDDEKGEGVWLKLQNNMRFAIRTCTFGISAKGDPLLVADADVQIGVKYEVEVVDFYLFNPSKSKVPSGYSFGSSCAYTDIKSGESLSFSVPSEHLAQGLAITIPFEYDWEKIGEANPQHSVFFRYSSIPSAP